MVETLCPDKYLAYMYNYICGESVCGYGNRSTGKWVERQREGVHVNTCIPCSILKPLIKTGSTFPYHW